MKIALIGYGKMGHIIEEVALERGHEVVCKIDKDNVEDFESAAFAQADVAIEFTTPATAEANIQRAWKAGVPVVCGTTGWDVDEFRIKNFELGKFAVPNNRSSEGEIRIKNSEREVGLMWASNYSVGVNILFALNKQLAKLMANYSEYTPHMTEVHHIHKLDAPSGTAKTLQEAILAAYPQPLPKGKGDFCQITSIREGEVPGIHTVVWESDVDSLSISHSAKSRKGFALGAVIAAEWMKGKTGWHEFAEVVLN